MGTALLLSEGHLCFQSGDGEGWEPRPQLASSGTESSSDELAGLATTGAALQTRAAAQTKDAAFTPGTRGGGGRERRCGCTPGR